jgi:hypothetical protein
LPAFFEIIICFFTRVLGIARAVLIIFEMLPPWFVEEQVKKEDHACAVLAQIPCPGDGSRPPVLS